MAATRRKTQRYQFGDVVVRCVDDVSRASAQTWAASFASWFGPDRRAVPGAESKTHVAMVESALGLAVAKRERARGLKRGLTRHGVRRFQRETAFERALAFDAAGLPTAAPIACILVRARADACSLMRWIDGLDPWRHVRAPRDSERAREQLVEALARLVARMHAAKFRHRDLKAPNLIVARNARELAVSVVDLDGLASVRSISLAMRVRDLGRLCVSFGSASASAAGMAEADWKRCVELYVTAVDSLEQRALDRDLLVRRTRAWAAAHCRDLSARGREIA